MLSCLNKDNYCYCYHYYNYDIAIVTYFFVRLFSIFVFLSINEQQHSYPSGPHGSPFFVGFVLPILFFLFICLSTASCVQYRLCLFISPVLSCYRQTTELPTPVSHLSLPPFLVGFVLLDLQFYMYVL